MKKYELSATDFILINKSFTVLIGLTNKLDEREKLFKLKNKFKNAYTGYLEIDIPEDGK